MAATIDQNTPAAASTTGLSLLAFDANFAPAFVPPALLGGQGTAAIPPASPTVLGGVKEGTGLAIASDGTASVAYGTTAGTAAAGNDLRIQSAVQQSSVPAGAAILGTSLAGQLQAMTLGTGLVLSGTTLSAPGGGGGASLPSGAPLVGTTSGGAAQAIALGTGLALTGTTLNVTAQLTLPASAPLIGATSGGAAQAIALGSGLALTGTTLNVTYSYTLPAATTLTLGGVKVDGATITATNGIISAVQYALPTATATVLGGVKVPAAASLLGSTGGSALQSISLDPSLTLTGTTLAVAQTAPSALAVATTLTDTDELPVSQDAGATFGKTATPLLLKSYMDGKRPASAALLGTTAQGVEQAITLGSGLTLSGTTLNAAGGSGSTFSRPALASFAWFNQGSCTATDFAGGPLVITSGTPINSDNIQGLVMAAPAAPWTLTVCLSMWAPNIANYGAGIIAANSGSTVFSTLGLVNPGGGSTPAVYGYNWSGYSTAGANLTFVNLSLNITRLWLRITNDGTNLDYRSSQDGFSWSDMAIQTVAAGGNPNQIGFFLNAWNSTGAVMFPMRVSLHDWELLTTASPAAAATNATL